MGLFDGWFRPASERRIEKLDKQNEKDAALDMLDISNLDGYNIVEAGYAVNTVSEGLSSMQKQASLIDQYREMALYPLVDDAIDDIANGIVSCDADESPVSIVLDKLDDSKKIQKRITEEFNNIISMLNFEADSYDIVRGWYTDGILALHPIVDPAKEKDGIQRIITLDPRGLQKINKVKITKDMHIGDRLEELEEFYIYDVSSITSGLQKSKSVFTTQNLLKISKNAMVVCTSGMRTADGNQVLSDLEKSRKVLNDVKNMENAMVIYRIARAAERKAFYIDTGTLPAKASAAYVQEVMNKHRNGGIEYNPSTGEIVTEKTNMAITEDYWLPRREGGRGTEIGTVDGAGNLNEIEDILLTHKKLVKALNVPPSRLDEGASLILGGKSSEASREEWKFQKFIERKRRHFSKIFIDLLRIQLITTGVCSEEEWEDDIKGAIGFSYASDSFQKDQQELENFAQRLDILADATEHLGTYFSKQTIERDVLGRSDEDSKEEQARIDKEEPVEDETDENEPTEEE